MFKLQHKAGDEWIDFVHAGEEQPRYFEDFLATNKFLVDLIFDQSLEMLNGECEPDKAYRPESFRYVDIDHGEIYSISPDFRFYRMSDGVEVDCTGLPLTEGVSLTEAPLKSSRPASR